MDGRAGNRRRVLIVDDFEDAANSLAMWFELRGTQTWVAANGNQALELAATHRPDVVLLDLGMPNLNGFEVARRMRRESWGASILLIAITGFGRHRDVEAALAAGCDAHLLKPVDLDQLEACIEKMAARRAADTGKERP